MSRPLVWFVTGGTGSLGTALTLRLLADGHRVRAFARNEHGHERLYNNVPTSQRPRLSNLVGDVRDRERLRRAAEGADICIHAAAMKVIPRCEYDPEEAVKTNVLGTANVAQAIIDADVSKAIMISTDKARAPCTHYGSCKLAAERLWLASNVYLGSRPHRFALVIYGNVFGSQGSVLQAFREQAKSGSVYVTDAKCTRFSIRMSQAVDLVLEAVRKAAPGEAWIPRLPSYRVIDMAEAVAPKVPIEITGLRANEKLHELLITEDEAPFARLDGDHYVLTPGTVQGKGGWDYHSGRNTWRLSVDDLRKELEAYDAEAACTST